MVTRCDATRLVNCSRAMVRAWESLQVELQGQYSLARLSELAGFTRRTGTLRCLAIAIWTPLAYVIFTIVPDALPLRQPINGIFSQSFNYWVRLYYSLVLVSAMLVGPIWLVFLLTAILALWGTTIRTDPEVQRDLKQFNWYVLSQFSMTTIYPVMIYAFGTLNGTQQTVFSISFPVVKLMLKNSASRGVYNLEDLAPVFVVLGVDVFHALLLSGAMRTATSLGTYISVMATDVFQNIVAVAKVRMTMNQLKRLRLKIREAQATPSCVRDPLDHTDVFTYATSLLESHPHLRVDPSIALPRHQRQPLSRPLNVARHVSLRLSSLRGRLSSAIGMNRIAPFASANSPQEHHIPSSAAGGQTLSTQKITLELEYVRLSLALLHMIECYVLVEFTEVIVPIIYAINLAATFHLPNRNYYLSVRTLTQEQLTGSVVLVLQYAALELLSLVVLCVILDRLVGNSTLRLLAFTLRKHALLAQSLLMLWVSTATLLTLEHFGNDYTFRFKWLRYLDEQK